MSRHMGSAVIVCLAFLSAATSGAASGSSSDLPYDVPSQLMWTKASGPEGGKVIGLGVTAGNTEDPFAFAAVQPSGGPGRIYVAQDAQQTWQLLSTDGLPADIRMNGFVVSPAYRNDKTLRLSGYDDQYGAALHTSTDGGVTWRHDSRRSYCFVIEHSNEYASDRTVVAACGMYLWRSTDGGLNWEQELRRDSGFTDVGFSPAYHLDDTILAVERYLGIVISTDRGETWAASDYPLDFPYEFDRLAFSKSFSVNEVAYANSGTDLWAGTPEGWTSVTPVAATDRIQTVSIVPSAVASDEILLGTRSGLFISRDGGDAWTGPDISSYSVNDVIWSPDFGSDGTGWIVSDGGGVLRTADSGDSWIAANEGMLSAEIRDLEAISCGTELPFLATAVEGAGVFTSTDGGQIWDWASHGITRSQVSSVAIWGDSCDKLDVLAGVNGGVFFSDDSAVSWRFASLDAAVLHDVALSPDFGNDGIAVAATNAGTFRSEDGAASWLKVQGLSSAYEIAFSPRFTSDRTILAGTVQGLIRSEDAGKTWTYVNNGLPDANEPEESMVWALAYSPDFERDSTVYAGIYQGVYRSTDGGLSWSPYYAGMLHPYVEAVITVPRGEDEHLILAAARLGTDYGLYITSSERGVWSRVQTPFPASTPINALQGLCGVPIHLVVGTGGDSVWHARQMERVYLPAVLRGGNG